MHGNRQEQWQCNSVSNEYHQSQNNSAVLELNTILISKSTSISVDYTLIAFLEAIRIRLAATTLTPGQVSGSA
jgi:hypothetical protein